MLSLSVLPVQPNVFRAIETMDVEVLKKCTEDDLRPVLPCLVRMSLCTPLDSSDQGKAKRKKILSILSRMEVVNSIVDMLSIDFHSLEQDVKKEQQLRSKLGGSLTDSVLISQLPHGIALAFEQNSSAQRIRILLSELLFISSELKDQKANSFHKQSDLFESEVYIEEILHALCIAVAELPQLLNLPDVAEALICVDHGPDLLCQVVANAPESFLQVCQSLISRGEKQDEDSTGGKRRCHLLHMLAAINPKAALTMRNYCVEHCTLPGFAVSISLQPCHAFEDKGKGQGKSDIVPFLTSLLLGSDVNVRNWIANFVKMGQKKKPEWPSLVHLRKHLLNEVIGLTPSTGKTLNQGQTVDACASLRLYCALKAIATMKYSEEEVAALLRLVISNPELSATGAHFISLGICMLIASPGLLRGPDEEQQTLTWLRWIMSQEEHFHMCPGMTNSPGEMLFLLALNFHNNQMQAVTELVCNTLGMKTTVKVSALVKLRQIFTLELFTEQIIAAHAVKIPVTPGLDARSTGYLPVHSILQLLKSRAFSKHKVSVKKWVYGQICGSCFPLHPLVPHLIESYVNSVIPKSAKPEHTNEPLSEEEIAEVFSSPAHDASFDSGNGNRQLCPQLLILYYLLLYEDLYQTHKKMIDIRHLQPYSDRVFAQIPISLLVQEALKQENNCQNLFPPMIRLLSCHFPHLCLVDDWLDMHAGLIESEARNTINKIGQRSAKLSADKVREVLSEAKSLPGSAIRVLEQLLKQNDYDLLQGCQDVLVACIPMLLEPDTPRHLQDLVKRVWFRLHALTPRRLRVNTVNMLQENRKAAHRSNALMEQDLVVDPLVVLRCDDRVFRCPPFLAILLRILSAYTQACRVYLSAHVLEGCTADKEKDRQELKNALLAAQESAIVQILLEVCLPTQTEKAQSQSELCDLREVRCLIFSYIHQVFIADTHLAKLVHFQGYPSELIPLVVAGVPSMHICLDFIPELLGQPQKNKQVFGVQLLAQLCCQFHIPKAMNTAKLGIDVMFTLLSVLEKQEWESFFQETIPSLVPICQSFPPLCDDATSLLLQLGHVCYAHLTVEGNATKSNACLSSDLSRNTDNMLPTDTFNESYEALYKSIQTTFSQICGRALVLGKLY